jgi:hypothetical protein
MAWGRRGDPWPSLSDSALPLAEFGGFVSDARNPFRARRSYPEPETGSLVSERGSTRRHFGGDRRSGDGRLDGVVPEAGKFSGAARLRRRTVSPARYITARHRARLP